MFYSLPTLKLTLASRRKIVVIKVYAHVLPLFVLQQDEESSPVLSTAVQNHFKTVHDLKTARPDSAGSRTSIDQPVLRHHQSIISIAK